MAFWLIVLMIVGFVILLTFVGFWKLVFYAALIFGVIYLIKWLFNKLIGQ